MQAGDPLEVQGVSSVFSDSRSAEQPLIIGSVSSCHAADILDFTDGRIDQK